jgi:predicted RNase H-like HicB family nuclease
MSSIKIIVERHEDGFIAYPVGMRGAVVGEGDSYDEALADVRSAIQFHIETFGTGVMDSGVFRDLVADTDSGRRRRV